jgi:hypothetical protein
MRSRKALLFPLLIISLQVIAQGNSCSNAITIPLDGTCNDYAVSTSTGASLHCNGGAYGGNGRVTYFRFTTNASAECVLLDMATSIPGESIEAVLFTGCSGGTPTGGSGIQSICMDEGSGIWATNLWAGNLLPNTTYYLRVRTESGFAGTIRICGKYYSPPNNFCSGATGIDLNASSQNNACNTGSTEVPPASLCAGSLENTAWYSYTVQVTGISSIVISNIRCVNANFAGNNDYGFQIGFFTGSCGNLTSLGCNAQTGVYGGTVTSATVALAAGTVVYVAIDGFSGSNCTYNIGAINAIPLPVRLKYFTVWKAKESNLLRWVTLSESNSDFFEIERSADGTAYEVIGKVAASGNAVNEQDYFFNDEHPFASSYYRLKQVDRDGLINYSRIVHISRTDLPAFTVQFANPAGPVLKLMLQSALPQRVQSEIYDLSGKKLMANHIVCNKGHNSVNYDLSRYTRGTYLLVITQGDGSRKTYPFVRQ